MRPYITSGSPLITSTSIKEDLDKMVVNENCTQKQYDVMLEMYYAWIVEETERGDYIDTISNRTFR